MESPFAIASTHELSPMGIYHLKRLWSSTHANGNRQTQPLPQDAHLNRLVLDALGIGLNQAYQFLYAQKPSLDDFEEWVVATSGEPSQTRVERLNADITGSDYSKETLDRLNAIEEAPAVLSQQDLAFWQRNGYVIVRNAIDLNACQRAEKVIYETVGAKPDDLNSWYQKKESGIMVELIQNEALEANRRSLRIHKAFSQLWETPALWVTADRCGFHAPQRENHPFPGPDLHWDVDFRRPLDFATQGILYLTDTPPEQGALTLVPGFHHQLSRWLPSLPTGADPNQQDLHALGSIPIGANAGDMIIWHHHLPHGSRPNLGVRPRIVQYINMYPGRRHLA
ncbi:phytanoyl-CoA dioxygenase family protein [Vibrio variabilis]|uniref:phytanoyl-CoA dioxygenase family protein n=1 Tax=Vibrio variabilis TaxID=990271 RepID=UPI000DD9BC9B|nr:phytanoyl-CoA dioxygenase family protein [Vibrio variabilis]